MARYPGFHKHVNRIYVVIIIALSVGLPLLYLTIKQPSVKNIIAIIVCVIISYVIYWLIVRLNCYGTPNTLTAATLNNNNEYPHRIYTQSPPRSDSSTSSRSSTNGVNNHHPTFASYRLGGLTEIFRRFGGNNGTPNASDDEINEIEGALRPPPPTYNIALEGAGLPPPYMNDQIEISTHNSELSQMSETPRRPVPSVPSSSSLRRPVPPIPQQQSSTQSTQYTCDPPSPIISDSSPRRSVPSISQPPRRPVPLIPSSSLDNISQLPRRPVPPIPASSSSPLPPRLYKSISYDSKVRNNK
ncbi:hypothetical protein C1645_747123 [Glomus cerebriforme]|uniref:Uncharacterized protein n=1 Tax=Glomus cerebriforme TaxID=658196 RepID=A0A397TMY0_9GLOM|nr:hypothetical protein C1645_747123 [Glomus cerebriforme]